MSENAEKKAVKHTSLRLVALAFCMFAFCFWVLPPLYTLFCEVTGINGKISGASYEAVSAGVDESRTVRVKFVATKNDSMAWDFAPSTFAIDVHPGEAINTAFLAKNLTGAYMAGQAIPSMAPKNAIDYFHKTECFCFEQQILAPGENAELGIQFIVDQDLPKAVKSITLSYTLFDVTDRLQESIEQVRSARMEMKTTDTMSRDENFTGHSIANL
jgi:cytochrome c oxidase assembly protein subunit 11